MIFKYRLPERWISKISEMEEFANGATQVSVRLKDGREIRNVLLSNSTYIVAARGFKDLPFQIDDICDIFQSQLDKNPALRSGWEYWDDWQK